MLHMNVLSILVGKAIIMLMRLFGRKGSALAGLVVERTNPGFLAKMLARLPQGVIIVTGTNGKTTTTKIIADLLTSQGLSVLTNRSGSNFVRGIIATVLNGASLSGKMAYDIAVFEQDEAHAVHFVSKVRPRGVVALNVMRDQMDRFGEIDTTAKLIGKTTAAATDWVVLNANDTRISKLAGGSLQVHWFGHSEELLPKFLTDDMFYHKDKLSYFSAAEPDVVLRGFSEGMVRISSGKSEVTCTTSLDGSHNALNLTAALTAVRAVLPDSSFETLADSVSALQPAFGRGERIVLDTGAALRIQLVKNPGGFTHSLRLLETTRVNAAGIIINDDYADGRDVSWLWDVDFSILPENMPILTGGSRSYDMAVRLKHDGRSLGESIEQIPVFTKRFVQSLGSQDEAVLFCTYTAMLQLRDELKRYSKHVKRVEL